MRTVTNDLAAHAVAFASHDVTVALRFIKRLSTQNGHGRLSRAYALQCVTRAQEQLTAAVALLTEDE